ncbi:hypothetical protein [Nonomuraea rubra]|uniref:Uncharacterized protein n=1 Tax=Nonomuraea rubra TaxID=46180 RepID=A0A7X0U0D7_9ACTN|nr:hypothetical protein [Nonomuraea rubra]MBB6550438.1 hypothetical protein [Nonomuraea rubra]
MSLRKRPLSLILAFLLSVPVFAATTGTAHAALITYCYRDLGSGRECASASYLSLRGGTVESASWTAVHLYTDSNVTNASYSSTGTSGHTTMTHPRLSPAYSTCKWTGFKGTSRIVCKYRT